MAKISLPKGSGKRLKVREKSGNFEMDIEWQPCFTMFLLVSSADNFCKQFGPKSGPTICPDLDPKCLTLMLILSKNFSKKVILKKSRQQKSMKNFPVCKS